MRGNGYKIPHVNKERLEGHGQLPPRLTCPKEVYTNAIQLRGNGEGSVMRLVRMLEMRLVRMLEMRLVPMLDMRLVQMLEMRLVPILDMRLVQMLEMSLFRCLR
ncbi:hypothetical protein TRIUR3_34990 [Triticum urartu]|uniref:Uncharacterized protein n=1 Tax=Triticum urartu TaxID=4572 RepID=M7YB71_TRIUA|nr:hypothetical protein TRIUR3_34990 [Triticum urartu]